MKTLLSIPLLFLLLFTGINVKIATHYCGGHVAATMVSLNGELATCGMESDGKIDLTHDSISRHCCEDVTTSFSISNIYVPSFFNIDNQEQNTIDFKFLPPDLMSIRATDKNNLNHTKRPPGSIILDCPDQPVLCIFRI